MKKSVTTNDNSSQALALALAEEAPPARLAAVLADALSATTQARNGSLIPDMRTRIQAASLILSYAVGTPVQRSESVIVNLDADQGADVAKRLRHSPALREAMRRALTESETVDV